MVEKKLRNFSAPAVLVVSLLMLVISFGWKNILNSFPKLLWVKAGFCQQIVVVL